MKISRFNANPITGINLSGRCRIFYVLINLGGGKVAFGEKQDLFYGREARQRILGMNDQEMVLDLDKVLSSTGNKKYYKLLNEGLPGWSTFKLEQQDIAPQFRGEMADIEISEIDLSHKLMH